MRTRSLCIRMLVLLSLLSLIAACGGGDGGGGGGGGGGVTPLATGGFVKTANITDDNNNNFPFSGTIPVQTFQQLYLASEIQGAGYLNKISFRRATTMASPVTCASVTVKVGHTVVTAVTAIYANNVENGAGSLTTVIDSGTITIPAGAAAEYFDVSFSTPFYYNGIDNLVVEFKRQFICSATAQVDLSTVAGSDRQANSSDLGTTAVFVGPYLRLAKFHFAGGENLLYSGPAATYNSPFTTTAAWRHLQMMHTAATISGSGPITGIGVLFRNMTSAATYTVTIKMGHSVLSALTATYANNFSDSPVTVANGLTFSVPTGVPVGTPVWLPITGSFTYNGIDNLLVDIDVAGGSVTNPWAYTSVANSSVYGAYGSVLGSVDVGGQHTVLRFNGGPVSVITDGGGSVIIPIGTPEHIVQILYDHTLLGTGGRVDSLAFRLATAASATVYSDIRLVMGHRLASAPLGTASLAANISSDRTTVFSGTLAVPAGLKAGDWITVPLTTSFTYDPTKNLVVQWDRPAFSTANSTRGSSTSTRYAGCVQGNIGNRAADVSNASGDFVLDMRLVISK